MDLFQTLLVSWILDIALKNNSQLSLRLNTARWELWASSPTSCGATGSSPVRSWPSPPPPSGSAQGRGQLQRAGRLGQLDRHHCLFFLLKQTSWSYWCCSSWSAAVLPESSTSRPASPAVLCFPPLPVFAWSGTEPCFLNCSVDDLQSRRQFKSVTQSESQKRDSKRPPRCPPPPD